MSRIWVFARIHLRHRRSAQRVSFRPTTFITWIPVITTARVLQPPAPAPRPQRPREWRPQTSITTWAICPHRMHMRMFCGQSACGSCRRLRPTWSTATTTTTSSRITFSRGSHMRITTARSRCSRTSAPRNMRKIITIRSRRRQLRPSTTQARWTVITTLRTKFWLWTRRHQRTSSRPTRHSATEKSPTAPSMEAWMEINRSLPITRFQFRSLRATLKAFTFRSTSTTTCWFPSWAGWTCWIKITPTCRRSIRSASTSTTRQLLSKMQSRRRTLSSRRLRTASSTAGNAEKLRKIRALHCCQIYV